MKRTILMRKGIEEKDDYYWYPRFYLKGRRGVLTSKGRKILVINSNRYAKNIQG